jgi:hypothetical protein
MSQEGEHGRLDLRRGALAAISPVSAGLPGARSAMTVQRDWSEKRDPLQPQKSNTRFFLSSLGTHEKSRSTIAARNLALTRNVLLAIIPFEQGQSLAHFFEHYHRHPHHALRLILNASPVL